MTEAPPSSSGETESSVPLSAFCRIQFSVSHAIASLSAGETTSRVLAALTAADALSSQPDGSLTKVRFGPVLPPGCASAGEFCDAEIRCQPDGALRAFNSAAPEGIAFLRVDRIDTKAVPVGQLVVQADYCFEIPGSLTRACDLEALRDLFGEQPDWMVRKENAKGEIRERDLKKAVSGWTVAEGEGTALLRLRLLHVHEEGHTASPASVLENLLDLDLEQCRLVRVTREYLRDRNGLPLGDGPWPRKRNRLLRGRCWEQQRYGL